MLSALDASPSTLGQRYRVVRMLARGGMGVVYEVQHLTTGKTHAAKLIQSAQLEPATLLERFHREARSAARIGSRHVVDITDAGLATELGGTPFIIMERLVGCDLAELLARRGHLSPREVVALIAQVASALEAAHRLPLLHRDLKPANLFLHREPDGEVLVKMLDFGLATSVRDLLGDRSVTATGDIMGTPAYMAPEQAQGLRDGFGPATDLWAMGMIAFELLSGECYFAGQPTGVIIAHLVTAKPIEPPSQLLPGFGEAFDRWFAKSCHVHASARFTSAMDQARALADALGVAMPAPGERLPITLAPEVEGPAPALDTTVAHVADHLLRAPSTLKATSATPPPAEAGRTAMWALAAVAGVATLVAITVVVLYASPATETTPASSQHEVRSKRDAREAPAPRSKLVVPQRREASPDAGTFDLLRTPELVTDTLADLGDDVTLQQVFIYGPTATIEARTPSHPDAFIGYVISEAGVRKQSASAIQRAEAEHFSPALVDLKLIRHVLAEADRRFAERDVIETMFIIIYERIIHRQVVYRVIKKLANQQNAFVNFDVRGKRLGEQIDGRYHLADD